MLLTTSLVLATLRLLLWNEIEYNVWDVPFPVVSSQTRPTTIASVQSTDRDFSDLQVVLKSGTAELGSKLSRHLETITSIVPRESLLIFSDASTQLGSFDVLDALDNLSDEYKSQYPEFSTYKRQKQALANGKVLDKTNDGWKLDKHKFLPMISKTVRLHLRYEISANRSQVGEAASQKILLLHRS